MPKEDRFCEDTPNHWVHEFQKLVQENGMQVASSEVSYGDLLKNKNFYTKLSAHYQDFVQAAEVTLCVTYLTSTVLW